MRDATEKDLPAILQVMNEIILSSTAIYENDPQSLAQFTEAYRQKTALGFPTFVVELQGKIVGYCGYGPFRPRVGYAGTVEDSLHLMASARGKGLGSAMLAHLIEHAKRRGYHAMIGVIDSEAELSVLLHEKHGFVRAGTLPEVGRKFDRWLNLVLMVRKLV